MNIKTLDNDLPVATSHLHVLVYKKYFQSYPLVKFLTY